MRQVLTLLCRPSSRGFEPIICLSIHSSISQMYCPCILFFSQACPQLWIYIVLNSGFTVSSVLIVAFMLAAFSTVSLFCFTYEPKVFSFHTLSAINLPPSPLCMCLYILAARHAYSFPSPSHQFNFFPWSFQQTTYIY